MIHVVAVATWHVPRGYVAAGSGVNEPPFRLPSVFLRPSVDGVRGPSLYLTINRPFYEDDLVTDTGNEYRQRAWRYVRGRRDTLQVDRAVTPDGEVDRSLRTGRLHHTSFSEPEFFGGPRDPLSAYEQLRRAGALHRVGARLSSGDMTWWIDHSGRPVRFRMREPRGFLDVRFVTLERLPLDTAARAELQMARD